MNELPVDSYTYTELCGNGVLLLNKMQTKKIKHYNWKMDIDHLDVYFFSTKKETSLDLGFFSHETDHLSSSTVSH